MVFGLLGCLFALAAAACNAAQTSPAPTTIISQPTFPLPAPSVTPLPPPTATPTPLPPPPRVLTICLGREPRSLFLYQASSQSERSVLQAIYDGPYDVVDYTLRPVILASAPSLADGSVSVQPVEVSPGDILVDANGNLAVLQEGVTYRPSGCNEATCALIYSGDQPVSMDQLVIHFKLLPGLTWSDGAALTADDSRYSYEVAKSLFGPGEFGQIDRTAVYQVLDENTLEWRGVAGYQDTLYLTNFYSPLPRHLWGGLTTSQLLSAEISAQKPVGWGPYVIDEWISGDHITLHKNPSYFRSQEGLPHFDNLVYRFVADGEEALNALLAGECDLVDPGAASELPLSRLQPLQQQERVALAFQRDTAWEMAVFGIDSLDTARPKLFALKEVRQALAMCVDRQQMVGTLMYGQSQVLDAYLPPDHPLHNPDLKQYTFDPQAAGSLLQSVGWLDADNDPSTPRVASGVQGVPDGTALEFTYLVSADAERQAAAEILVQSMAQCGVAVKVEFQEPAAYLAAGPDGPVFGRHFDMAQFALPVMLQPPCQYFTSSQIPGPYPDFPLGWGGMNAAGYSSLAFDQACQTARTTLTELPEHQQAHFQAQAVFAEDLPAIPLYTRYRVFISRADLCHLSDASGVEIMLWNLESLDYAEGCQ